ncbi:MAG: hypothetical protein ACJ790_16505 [Myxococcaceae bacterium]
MDDRIQLAVTVGDHSHPELARGLERAGLNVLTAKTGIKALELLKALGLRCVVVLTRLLPTQMAISFLTRLQADYPDCKTRFPVLVGADERGRTEIPVDCPCVVGTVSEGDLNAVETAVKDVI